MAQNNDDKGGGRAAFDLDAPSPACHSSLPKRCSLGWQGWQPPKMYDSGPRDIRHSLTPILPPACLFNPVETSRPLRVSEPYPECLDVIADFYHPPAGFATGVEIRTNVENPFESTTTTAGSDTSPASGGGCPRRLTPQAVGFPDFVGVPDLEYDEITDEKILGYRVNDGHPYNRDTQEVREVLIGDKENGEAEDVKSTTNVESTSKEVHSDIFDTSTKTPASAAPRNPAGHVPPSDEAPTTTTLTFQQPQEKSSLIGSETVDCENDREKEEEELTRLITAAQQSFVDTDGHFVELSASMPSPSGRLDSHALPAGLSVAPVSGFHDKHLVQGRKREEVSIPSADLVSAVRRQQQNTKDAGQGHLKSNTSSSDDEDLAKDEE